MRSFLTLLFIIPVLLLIYLSCDLGLEIQDPLAEAGAFNVTITNWYSEVRTVAGRPVTVKIRQDTMYSDTDSEDVIYSYSGGVMDILMKNDEYGMKLRFLGGIEGTALRGEYTIIPYDGNAPVQQNQFYSTAETRSVDGTVIYFSDSETGTVSIAMYRPNKRLGANFKFRARATSEMGNGAQPDSVTFIGGFNAMFQKEE
jgi:hypothetical protein